MCEERKGGEEGGVRLACSSANGWAGLCDHGWRWLYSNGWVGRTFQRNGSVICSGARIVRDTEPVMVSISCHLPT